MKEAVDIVEANSVGPVNYIKTYEKYKDLLSSQLKYDMYMTYYMCVHDIVPK